MIKGNIKEINLEDNFHPNLKIGLEYLLNNDFSQMENGRYQVKGNEVYALVQEYQTKPLSEAKFEAHKLYADIQFVIKGKERIGYNSIYNLVEEAPYSEEKDIIFYSKDESKENDFVCLEENDFVIFYPEDAHMPSVSIDNQEHVKKVVVKVLL